MHQLRKDYLLEQWVIIAGSRKKRPQHLKHKNKRSPKNKCPLCPGHESWTPKEVLALPNSQKWNLRVVPNKYPAVQIKGVVKKTGSGFKKSVTATGAHEVVIETPSHYREMHEYSIEEMEGVLKVYKNRFKTLSKKPGVKEVTIFKNQGVSAGASLSHAHSQIIAFNQVSQKQSMQLKAFKKSKKCPYCKIIKNELKSKRAVFNGKHFACFTPFASRAAYQLLIFPKKHKNNILKLSESETKEFAAVIKAALRALNEFNADFNYFFQMPIKSDFHMHLNLMPRLLLRAGFEEATECIINIVSPEDAAAFYRPFFKGLKCR